MSYSKNKSKKNKKTMRRNKKAGFVKKEHLNQALTGAKNVSNAVMKPITGIGNAVISAVSTGPRKLFTESKKEVKNVEHMGKHMGKHMGHMGKRMGHMGKRMEHMGKHMGSDVERMGKGVSKKGFGLVKRGMKDTRKLGRRVVHVGKHVGKDVKKMTGGSGRCCFKAKTCNSRKRRGNRSRHIKKGHCCIPVKSRDCGAKTKKRNKKSRQRGGG